MAEWRQGSAIGGVSLPDDPRQEDWHPPAGLLSRNERDELSEAEQRTLGRNRLGFYELSCGRCTQFVAVHQSDLSDDGEVWLCPDCRSLAN